jgi:hypothetical protein
MHVPFPGTTKHPLIKITEDEFLSEVKNFLIFFTRLSPHTFTCSSSGTGAMVSCHCKMCMSYLKLGLEKSTREWTEWGEPLAFGKAPSTLGCADVNGMMHVLVYSPWSHTHTR